MSSNPKTRLAGIFQDASAASSSDQGNSSLRYVAPKEPTRSQQQAAATATSTTTAAAAPEKASSIVYTTTVSLYQYDATARTHVQVLNPNASPTIGCVIVGSDASYNVLFYNAAKQHVCVVPLKFATFKPILQAKSYVSFYDDKGVNWSIKFASDALVSEFMRQVFLTKIHVEIWGDDKSVTKTSPNALIKDDLVYVKDDAPAVGPGDAVALSFSCWRVVGNVTCAPSDVVTKYAPFEKATEAELRKFRIGDGSERIKALEEGVIGMKKGGKRIILAPPGKTTGQDWYLIEVQLVRTKIGGSVSQRKSVPNVSTAAAAAPDDAASAGKAAKTPRRRSSPSRSSSAAAAANGDIVPWGNDAAQDELKLKEQQVRLLQEQLDAIKSSGMTGGFGSMAAPQQQTQPFGFAPQQSALFGAPSALFSNSALFSSVAQQQQQQALLSMSSRPLDALLTELHAKVDYLIRIAPAPSAAPGSSSIGGVTDVAAVIRGVERLASENDRLMVQINSQNQQYVSYEKRCEELLKQSQQLQDEKRRAEEKYQAIASQQLTYSAEVASLTSARDAAITQTNRLHAEYQQLLTAFYQKQQVSTVSDEQRNELTFEREARVRLERELKKETQTRSLVEQELQLTKKQYDVYMKLKDSELATQKHELEQQWLAAKTQELQASDERLRLATLEFQQQAAQQQADAREELERKDKLVSALEQQVQALESEKQVLSSALEGATARVETLESELQAAVAARPGADAVERADRARSDSAATIRLADEEKAIYVQQIALLQEQVKDLEAAQFARVQSDLDSGRLASPAPSPRSGHGAKAFGDAATCEHCASVSAKEEAAERALALAQTIKRETEEMLESSSPGASQAAAAREKLTSLFKEAVNEMFFRFHDYFDEGAAVESKQVLAVIRRVLKQSTKDVLQKLHDADDGHASDASDGPPAPPPLEPSVAVAVPDDVAPPAASDALAPKTAASERVSAAAPDVDAEPISHFMEQVSDRMHLPGGYVSSSDDDDGDFED